MEKERNRNLMLYDFKCGYSAAAATQKEIDAELKMQGR
jgi:hypothetical protein